MTISATFGSALMATATPFSTAPTISCAVGDFLICMATGYEYSSAVANSRTLAASSGWSPLAVEELQLYPTGSGTNPNRRQLLGLWWKRATATVESATVTMTGGNDSFLSLHSRIGIVSGLVGPFVSQGGVTRRENVDLGVNPALTWTYSPLSAGGGRDVLLLTMGSCDLANPTGWTPVVVPPSAPQIHGGDVTLSISAVSNTSPGTVTRANRNGRGLITSIAFKPLADGHCAVFEGLVTDVVAAGNVQLSLATNALPGAVTDYRIDFLANTTGNATPSSGLLNSGPWTLGPMAAGTYVRYAVSRVDGAHIGGSAVMRATDVPFGTYWDVTVECLGGGGAYQFRRGRRTHIAGATGVSIQGR